MVVTTLNCDGATVGIERNGDSDGGSVLSASEGAVVGSIVKLFIVGAPDTDGITLGTSVATMDGALLVVPAGLDDGTLVKGT